MRTVIDTGVFVSALIHRQGTTGAVLSALRDAKFSVIFSTAILIEIIEVLGRPKFRLKYHIEANDTTELINLIRLRGELVTPNKIVSLCRDPLDDKFLEAALAGKTDCIVTGDDDLLVLNPFQGIQLLRPSEFIARL